MSIYHLKNLCALNSFKLFKSQQEFISYPESVRTSKAELVGSIYKRSILGIILI